MRGREEKEKGYGFSAELEEMGMDDYEEDVTFDLVSRYVITDLNALQLATYMSKWNLCCLCMSFSCLCPQLGIYWAAAASSTWQYGTDIEAGRRNYKYSQSKLHHFHFNKSHFVAVLPPAPTIKIHNHERFLEHQRPFPYI